MPILGAKNRLLREKHGQTARNGEQWSMIKWDFRSPLKLL